MSPRNRYQVEQLPAEGQHPGMYVVRDTTTGELVLSSDGSELERWTMKFSAERWIAAERSLGRA